MVFESLHMLALANAPIEVMEFDFYNKYEGKVPKDELDRLFIPSLTTVYRGIGWGKQEGKIGFDFSYELSRKACEAGYTARYSKYID